MDFIESKWMKSVCQEEERRAGGLEER